MPVFLPLAALAIVAPVPVPPVPVHSERMNLFAAQVGGRAALSDAMFAFVTASAQHFDSVWRFVTFDESGKMTNDLAGRESLALDRTHHRASLVTSTNGGKETTRYVVADGRLLWARLENGKRTAYGLPAEGQTATVANALRAADADRAFLGAWTRTALFDYLTDATMRYAGTVYTDMDGSVIETLPPTDDAGHRKITYRRHRFAPKSHVPLSREEWATWQDANKPLLLRSYWCETLTHHTGKTAPQMFLTKPAPGYAEVAPPSVVRELPLPPGADTTDARAKPLLLAWIRAASRFTTLDARMRVAQGVRQQTPESAPTPDEPERELVYDFQYKRPGKLRFLIAPDTKPTRKEPNLWTETLLATSDGETMALFDGDKLTHRRGDFKVGGDDGMTWYAIYRAGFYDIGRVLPCYFWMPQAILDDTESVIYRGALPVPGTNRTAEAVTLTLRYSDAGARRKNKPGTDETRYTNTITLFFDAATGMPLRVEQFIRYVPSPGTLLRDTRPNEYFWAQCDRLRVNVEPDAGLFVLPDAPK